MSHDAALSSSGDDADMQAWRAMRSIQTLLEQGEVERAIEELQQTLPQFPLNYMLHIFAAAVYGTADRQEDRLREYAIAFAIEPHNPVAYKRFAHLLRKRGETVLATRVLENGWEHCKAWYSPEQMEEERTKFFAE